MVTTSLQTPNSIKLLCSYAGKILPRRPDGKLRYVGGQTRVLAVDRSISFSDLLLKLGELHGSSVTLRCQLPEEDLDALVTVTSDEDLGNLIEEYELASRRVIGSQLKIRAFLWSSKSINKAHSHSSTSPGSSPITGFGGRKNFSAGFSFTTPVRSNKLCYYNGVSQPNFRYSRLVHNGNYWQ